MDNLKFLRENISELQRCVESARTCSYVNSSGEEIFKVAYAFLTTVCINDNTNVKKHISSRKYINIFDNYEENYGYFKKEIAPFISVLYNDFSVYYFDEHTEAEFMPEETYLYRKYIHGFLQNIYEGKANKYLQSLKEYIKQHKTQEKEIVKYISRELENDQKTLNNPNADDEVKQYMEKECLKKKQELKFYQDALSNNKDTM